MGQRDLSGDLSFDFFVTWNDSTLKLVSLQGINRYADRNVTVRIVPVDPATGAENSALEMDQTLAPGSNATKNVPQNGANSVTLAFNAKGGIAGYDTYIDVGPTIA